MDTIVGIEDFDDPAFDPFAEIERAMGMETITNPYPRLRELRQECVVHPVSYREAFNVAPDQTLLDMPHFLVLGHDAISSVLSNPLVFSNEIYMRNLGRGFGQSITTMDAPDHPKYRRIFMKAFTPVALAKWGRDVVTPVVEKLIDSFASRGRADLVREFAIEYPFRFIYGQLGMPEDDLEVFHKLAVALMCVSSDMDHAMEASRKMGNYFAELVEARRRNPGDDLISMLVQAEIDGEKLPEEVIIGFLRQLLNAAGDTTYRATGTALLGLLSTPSLFQRVIQDRSLVAPAIEEALRWDSPTIQIYRGTKSPTEINGVAIPAGAAIDVVIGSANRDETAYPDPDRFDIFRKRERSLMTFGFGPHVCIGQHLARLELTVALNALFDRLPNVRLDPDVDGPANLGLIKRSPPSLNVRFDA